MTGTPQDLDLLYEGMRKTGADIVKIAVSPRSMTDVGRLMELVQKHAASSPPLIAIALGPLGAITRIVAPKYGAPFVYASIGKGHEAAAGQIALGDQVHHFIAVFGIKITCWLISQ